MCRRSIWASRSRDAHNRRSMSWSPEQYLKFGNERLRPVLDLLSRVQLRSAERIVDLGCGTGTLTELVRARWPHARITGVDNSQEMLQRARAALPDVNWQLRDLGLWHAEEPVNLIVSNAA